MRTGRKVKRGVNEVKDTVKDTVKDLRRGVGESVSEVAEAVKVTLFRISEHFCSCRPRACLHMSTSIMSVHVDLDKVCAC